MAGINVATIGYAVLGGMVPTFIWLWFWLRNDDTDDVPEPRGLIALSFIAGIAGVLLILPLDVVVRSLYLDRNTITAVYAITEEIVKYGMVSFVVFKTRFLNEPLDYVTYLVTGALGFSALENTLYLIDPIQSGSGVASILITSNLRFLGATVLHSLMAATIGVMLGLVFYRSPFTKFIMTILALITVSALHMLFNFFIMDTSNNNIVMTLGALWVFGVLVLLLVQKVKNVRPPTPTATQ